MPNVVSFETAYYKGQPFDLKINGRAEVAQTCPVCSESRKKKSDPCLTYNSEKGRGICHHCGATFHKKELELFDYVNWFDHRKISKDTLDKFGISFDKAILFPFRRNGQTCFNKYRTPDKKFWIDKGAELIAFNLDALKGFTDAIIVEGEIDCLSMHEAGTPNVISVPNGAVKDGHNTFAWLDRSWNDMQHVERFIIATDKDDAGNNLANQLIAELRKRGKEAGRVIPRGNYKDVNEQLCAIGEIILDPVEEVRITPEKKIAGKSFKHYIIKDEPAEERGIIFINSVTVLSEGNVMLLTGPPKARKTRLAGVLVNESKLKTAYVDSEQGRKHSWRTGKYIPLADVYHMRGQDPDEITRVVNCIIDSNEYQLLVLDNLRDLISDFNNVEQSGKLELFLKSVSERIPTIAILHENKNSKSGQGHLGYGAAKVAQTTIRVQLVDVEDPAKGSYVECVHSRDEPFARAFLNNEGVLSNDNLIKVGGKSILQDELFRMLGDTQYSYDELLEKLAEIFGIMKSSAKNCLTNIKRACPNAITDRKVGQSKIYYVSSTTK